MKKIDYNKIITREHLDLAKYNAKFSFVDKVMALRNPHPKYMQRILNDHTTFMYTNFKINGEPLKLYPYQDMIVNDMHRFKYFRAANQIGKSLLLEGDAATDLLIDHGYAHNEGIVSQNLAVSTDRMRNVKSLLNSCENIDWEEDKGSADNMSVVTLDIKNPNKPIGRKVKYTNKLILAPCSAGLLSYALHKLNLDEFEFWDDVDTEYFINQIAEPRTYKTKGRITIFSNPNGAEHYGHTLENLQLPDGTKKYHTYVFNYLDCPGNTEEDLELAKVGKDRVQIESTLMAIRSLSDRYYFSADEVESSISKKLTDEASWCLKGKQSYWFMDVGAKRDHSVLVGATTHFDDEKKDAMGHPYVHVDVPVIHVYPSGYPLSRVVGSFDESHATDGWHYEKSVKEYLCEYQLVKGVNPIFGVDVTGNSGISPLFKSVGISPVDVTFSGPKKWAMYQRMKYFLERKLLHVVKCKEYDYQMKRIIVKKLATMTYNRVGHELDSDFDDVPDSVAGVIHMADNPVFVTPTIRRI